MPNSDEKVNDDAKAELAFLGCCLLDNGNITHGEGLGSECFSTHSLGVVWSYIWRLWDTGRPVDAVMLADVMIEAGVFDAIGGDDLLWQIVDSVPHGANGKYYAGRLRRLLESDESQKLDKPSHQEWIASADWKDKAEAAKEAAGQRCQVCNISRDQAILDTHHRTYERLGRELASDLIVLCRTCHQIFHDHGKLARPPRKGE